MLALSLLLLLLLLFLYFYLASLGFHLFSATSSSSVSSLLASLSNSFPSPPLRTFFPAVEVPESYGRMRSSKGKKTHPKKKTNKNHHILSIQSQNTVNFPHLKSFHLYRLSLCVLLLLLLVFSFEYCLSSYDFSYFFFFPVSISLFGAFSVLLLVSLLVLASHRARYLSGYLHVMTYHFLVCSYIGLFSFVCIYVP